MGLWAIALIDEPLVEPWHALVGAALIAANLAALPLLLPVLRGIAPERPMPASPWMWAHMAFAAGLFLLGNLLFAALIELRGLELDDLSAVSLLLATALWQGLIAGMLLLVVRLQPNGLRVLGLAARLRPRDLSCAVLAYMFATPAIFGAGFVWTWLLGPSFEEQKIAVLLQQLDTLGLSIAMVLAILVVPLLEELLFRGFLQSFIVARIGTLRGITLTAALFGISHGVSAFLPIFFLALVLGLAMHRTQSLYVPWVIHALNNGAALGMLLLTRTTPS